MSRHTQPHATGGLNWPTMSLAGSQPASAASPSTRRGRARAAEAGCRTPRSRRPIVNHQRERGRPKGANMTASMDRGFLLGRDTGNNFEETYTGKS